MLSVRARSASLRRAHISAFTLIELVVVILIIAILAALGIPSYKSVTTQNRMSGEMSDLASDVELSRSSAVKQGMPVTICASLNPAATTPACSAGTNWNSGWIVFTDIANNQTYSLASGDILLRTHVALQGNDTMSGGAGSLATGPFSGNVSGLTFNRMGGTSIAAGASNFAALSLHDVGNKLVWRQCLIVSKVGSSAVNTQTQNPGVCP